MMYTRTIHERFQNIWPEYENADLNRVCKFIAESLGLNGKGDVISKVKKNWQLVLWFIGEWEGLN